MASTKTGASDRRTKDVSTHLPANTGTTGYFHVRDRTAIIAGKNLLGRRFPYCFRSRIKTVPVFRPKYPLYCRPSRRVIFLGIRQPPAHPIRGKKNTYFTRRYTPGRRIINRVIIRRIRRRRPRHSTRAQWIASQITSANNNRGMLRCGPAGG